MSDKACQIEISELIWNNSFEAGNWKRIPCRYDEFQKKVSHEYQLEHTKAAFQSFGYRPTCVLLLKLSTSNSQCLILLTLNSSSKLYSVVSLKPLDVFFSKICLLGEGNCSIYSGNIHADNSSHS
jgi:hypothetical protein